METRTKQATKRELAAEDIRNAIETGFYQPGQLVSQRQISEDLGLSVTPIREAIIQLSATGIIERHSHHSIKVKEVNAERLGGIYYVRSLLEEEALKLSFGNIGGQTVHELKEINLAMAALIDSDLLNQIHSLDRQFHHAIFSECRNEALISSIEFVKSSFSVYALWRSPGRVAVSVEEHDELIWCLEARDLAGFIRAHRTHLETGLKAATGLAR